MNELKNSDNVPKCPECETAEYVKKNPIKEVFRAKKIKLSGQQIPGFYCTKCYRDFNGKKLPQVNAA